MAVRHPTATGATGDEAPQFIEVRYGAYRGGAGRAVCLHQGASGSLPGGGLGDLLIDGKKKEHLGTLHRPGKLFAQQALICQDHDFPSLATAKVAPYGIYDRSAIKATFILMSRPIPPTMLLTAWTGY